MKSFYFYFSTIFLFSFHANAMTFDVNKSQWPAGENVCLGRWQFERYNDCAYGENKKDPIYDIVGYNIKPATCHHWNFGEEVALILEPFDTINYGSNKNNYCPVTHKSLPKLDNPDFERYELEDLSFTVGAAECKEYGSIVSCRTPRHIKCTMKLIRAKKNQGKSECGEAPDETNPIKKVVGFKPFYGPNKICGTTQDFSGYSLQKESVLDEAKMNPASLTCTTGDAFDISVLEGAKSRLKAISKEALILSRKDGFCQLKSNLKEIVEEIKSSYSDSINNSSFELAERFLDKGLELCKESKE